MNQTLATALGVFLGTLPLLGAVVWNLISVDKQLAAIRAELLQIREELREIKLELARHGERLATLEERDRWTHPVVKP